MRALTNEEMCLVSGGEEATQVDDVVVRAPKKKPGGVVMITIGEGGDVGGDGGGDGGGGGGGGRGSGDVGDVVVKGLCGIAEAVKGLDGKLLYESDGDGVDELMNILNLASLALGGVGLASVVVRVATGTLGTASVMSAIASTFGDDIALRLAYAVEGTFAKVTSAIALTATGGASTAAAASALIEALVEGNPPKNCPAG